MITYSGFYAGKSKYFMTSQEIIPDRILNSNSWFSNNSLRIFALSDKFSNSGN